jgi:hypothetical protein
MRREPYTEPRLNNITNSIAGNLCFCVERVRPRSSRRKSIVMLFGVAVLRGAAWRTTPTTFTSARRNSTSLAIRSLDDSQRLLLAIDHAISLRSASLNDSRQ